MCSSCVICSHFVCSQLFSDGTSSVGRYLLCEVNVSDRSRLLLLDDRAIVAAVKAAVARIHGDYGTALCSRFSGTQCWKKYLGALKSKNHNLNILLYK